MTKLYDITKFASQTNYKPELESVFVKKDGEKFIYVATDSFRLVEIETEDPFLIENMREGFYSKDQWKIAVKSLGKKQDLNTLAMVGKSEDILKDYSYPSYRNIFPTETKEVDLPINFIDPKYYYEFVKFLEDFTDEYYFRFQKHIKQDKNKPLIFCEKWAVDGNSKATVLLMGMSD
jgi:hypothetical protein